VVVLSSLRRHAVPDAVAIGAAESAIAPVERQPPV